MIFHLNKIVIKTPFQNTSNTSVERLKILERNCEQAIKEELQYCQEISWEKHAFWSCELIQDRGLEYSANKTCSWFCPCNYNISIYPSSSIDVNIFFESLNILVSDYRKILSFHSVLKKQQI